MVKSPCEWKILEWDEKTQTNKQTYETIEMYLGKQMIFAGVHLSQTMPICERLLDIVMSYKSFDMVENTSWAFCFNAKITM